MSYRDIWGNPVYVMVKPPRAVAALLARQVRTSPGRVGLLHITLLPLGRAQDRLLEHLVTALHFFSEPAFRVCFDSVQCSGSTVALCGSEVMRGAIRFQAALRKHLIGCGVALPAYPFRPHITLNYRADGRGSEAVDPVSWLVEDIRLIESVTGQARHIEHRRWRLRAPESLAA